MGISFQTMKQEKYFISKYDGPISDKIILDAYKEYFEGDEWMPGYNELADLSTASFLKVTQTGLMQIITYIQNKFNENGVSVRFAVFADRNISFGMSRMYEALAYGAPFEIKIFKDMNEALDWLSNSGQPLNNSGDFAFGDQRFLAGPGPDSVR